MLRVPEPLATIGLSGWGSEVGRGRPQMMVMVMVGVVALGLGSSFAHRILTPGPEIHKIYSFSVQGSIIHNGLQEHLAE